MAKLVNCTTTITLEDILRSVMPIISPTGMAALRIKTNTVATPLSPQKCTTLVEFMALLQDSLEIDTDGCTSINVNLVTIDECGGNCVSGSTIPELISAIFVTDGTKTYLNLGSLAPV